MVFEKPLQIWKKGYYLSKGTIFQALKIYISRVKFSIVIFFFYPAAP